MLCSHEELMLYSGPHAQELTSKVQLLNKQLNNQFLEIAC
jgi:hypothetical protein